MRNAVYIPLGLLLLLSLPFIFTDLDLALQRPFFDTATSTWPTGEEVFWRGLYNFAPIPAIALGLISVATLLLSIANPPLTRYRKLSAYFFLTLLLGSGLITNALLKGEWGRPRPRQVIEFNGTEEFERLLHYDPSSEGKSFPCGHATIGFFFFALVPITSGWRRYVFLLLSLLFGLIIGLARMVQGGHFASDVLWAAAVMWFTSLALFKLLKLDQSLYTKVIPSAIRPPKWIPYATGTIVILLALLASTAWPYNKIVGGPIEIPPTTRTITLDYQTASPLQIRSGETLDIVCQANGHGFPKSKIVPVTSWSGNTLTYTFETKGFFTELDTRVILTLPPHLNLKLQTTPDFETLILPSSPHTLPNLKLLDLPESAEILRL
ncbi:MAG: phosphatase PAP2 family protein [Verrucomicrobiota bacterium]